MQAAEQERDNAWRELAFAEDLRQVPKTSIPALRRAVDGRGTLLRRPEETRPLCNFTGRAIKVGDPATYTLARLELLGRRVELVIGRRFDLQYLAEQWAEEERKVIAAGGESPVD